MLADELRNAPELEQFANGMYEPILVKNLENVQGDERDVILFSIGYGPDREGRVCMNFGPVNQDGGWRRLNVAISRARKEMIVFSVIRPEQIDVSRSRSEGVAGLRGFLDFAAKGSSALPVRKSADGAKRDSAAFARTIAEALTDEGYQVKLGIGQSDYKIDIGVIDPDKDGEYLLGILCESESNFALTNARDRNIVQPSVLAGLGWRIVNVHILDWLDNEKKVMAYLEGEIDRAKQAAIDGEPVIQAQPAPKKELTFEREEPVTDDSEQVYTPYVPEVIGDSEYYYDHSSDSRIRRLINAAVEKEAPVSKNTLMRYALTAFGIKKPGVKSEARFGEVFAQLELNTTERHGNVFVWRKNQLPEEYDVFRAAANGEKRKLDDVATEEISAAVVHILRTAVSLDRAELVKETVNENFTGYIRL